MRMIRKQQARMLESGASGEVRIVNGLFRLAAREIETAAPCKPRQIG
jgi:hypothetical protein